LTLKLSGAPSLDGQAEVPLHRKDGLIPPDSRSSYASRRRSSFPSDQSQAKAGATNFGTRGGDTLDIAIFKAQLEALRRWMLEAGWQGRFASHEASAAIAALAFLNDGTAAQSNSANDLPSRSLQDEVASAVYLLGDRRVARLR
jgi:hypothetical protein